MGSAGALDVELVDAVVEKEEEARDVVEIVEVDEGMDNVEVIDVVDVVEVNVEAVLEIDEAVDEDEVVEDEVVKDAPEGSGAQVSERSPASLKESFASLALTSNFAV